MFWRGREPQNDESPQTEKTEAAQEIEPTGPRLCPECGLDLSGVNIGAHLRGHWDLEPHPIQHREAHRRYHLLLAWAEAQEGKEE